LMDASKPKQERMAAFYRREDWFRVFTGSGNADIAQMITDFDKLGVIEERQGPTDLPVVPDKVWVESKPALADPVGSQHAATATGSGAEAARLAGRYKLRKFGKNQN
jgi:hypothetical protein